MEEAEADQNIRCSSLRAAGKELHKNQAKNDNTVAEMRIHTDILEKHLGLV